MNVTESDVLEHENNGPWRSLLATAKSMVASVSVTAGLPMDPVLGGGTRLMLSLHHRLSDDIDLFIRDPQWIGYLTPRLNEDIVVDAYEENAVSLKLRYPIGEIDFIVAMSLLNLPAQQLPGLEFKAEPIAEVLAKKLFYRGSMLTPRDLFDWWAIERIAPQEIPQAKMAALLKDRLDGIENALVSLNASAAAQTIWNALRTPFRPTLAEAVEFGLGRIDIYRKPRDFDSSAAP